MGANWRAEIAEGSEQRRVSWIAIGQGPAASAPPRSVRFRTKPTDAAPIAPEFAGIPSAIIQCVYGAEETDTLCPPLAAGAEVIRTAGGHHFDHDYEALARRILEKLERWPTGPDGDYRSSGGPDDGGDVARKRG
jgi:hypothetical protein